MLRKMRHFKRSGPGRGHVMERHHRPGYTPVQVTDRRYRVFNSTFESISSNQNTVDGVRGGARDLTSLHYDFHNIANRRSANAIDDSEHVCYGTPQSFLPAPPNHPFRYTICVSDIAKHIRAHHR